MRFIIENKENEICGHITFHEIDLYEANITCLVVYERYRGLGLGTFLLWNVYEYIKEFYPSITLISWDDCSDHYKRKDNIYRKVEARYLFKNGPEMIWKIYSRRVEIKYKKYKEEYKKNFNYNIKFLCYNLS